MEEFDPAILKTLYIPPKNSHKGQNGKLMVIGGSKLFHAASLWSLEIASKIVDMVFYSSVPENNQIVMEAKKEFRNGIIVPRDKIEDYIKEADCILIGPGLPRKEGQEKGDDDTKTLTESLLQKYPNKKWVIDGGSLQTINPQLIPQNAILTPHAREFSILSKRAATSDKRQATSNDNDLIPYHLSLFAREYNCVIVLKGSTDIVCGLDNSVRPPTLKLRRVEGGNAGMTKGGTGDVLAGLIAALYCKNNAFISAAAGSYINKKAGESLFKRVGYYYNSSDLVDEIPIVMKELII
ncbi:MAG: NAD(P)H-hydrate dehydratase [Candidatus Levybacteria bacterium]|nr:NAD(P)H-hydrate dehydratase [Candidatus Levybacteria bacterium]